MKTRILCLAGLACMAFVVSATAATISPQTDVTSTLGPNFFLDAASTGGGDATINEPTVANPARDFVGINIGPLGSEISITGIGWASSSTTIANDATSVTATITYLGANEVFGGGDDVVIGSVTDAYPQPHPGPGEVSWEFDAPLVAAIDGLGDRFRISIAPSNAGGNGSLRFKQATGGIKLSVAGTSTALVPEPASLLLAVFGIAGICAVRRKY